jgi:predicted methyltransferase
MFESHFRVAARALAPLVALTISTLPAAAASAAIPPAVAATVADSGRPLSDIARDAARKPADVLAFSQIKPGMHVAEFSPGNGYYTRLLSKLVGPKGRVYAIVPLTGYRDAREYREAYEGKPLPVDTELGVADIAEYKNVTVLWENVGQNGGQFPLPEQVDAVFTADNYHDFHTKGYGTPDPAAIDKAILQTLKTGGVYIVVDHAAQKGAGFAVAEALHRSDPDAAKAEILSAGFALDGESNALANPSDDKLKASTDPSMHDKTDEFVYRFVKPAGAIAPNRPKNDPLKNYYENTYVYNMGPGERHHFYHADGTYQEFGKDDMQAGEWFWDAKGQFCIVHQFPILQRQYNFCASDIAYHELGEKWQTSRVGRGTTTQTLLKGHVYP